MEQNEWAREVVTVIAESVRYHRAAKKPKWSTQKVADRCKELGMPSLTRSVITSIEMGTRESISVPEWLALAAALQVPAMLLLFPVGRLEKIRFLPGDERAPFDAVKWAEECDQTPDLGDVIYLFRRYEEEVIEAEDAFNELLRDAPELAVDERFQKLKELVESGINNYRMRIRERGLIPPALPQWLSHIDDSEA